jgi:aminoglycoside 6'-N-acetyltransferase I
MRWAIREVRADDAAAWVKMRAALWPSESAAWHENDVRNYLAHACPTAVAFLAFADSGRAIGFAEATIRSDHVNGTEASPVGFLEGWYVEPASRVRGVGRALVGAVEQWVSRHGCTELASDTWLDRVESQNAHVGCGFEETERVVYFRKRLAAAG